jgi:RNA polymerase sigma-70 factor (ECF subfamily)
VSDCLGWSIFSRPADRIAVEVDMKELMASRQPSPSEFSAAYRQHVDFVWRVLARRGVATADLEDTTQEVFMISHRRWGVWEGQASMRTWLYGVACRVASTHHRGRRRQQRKHDDLPAPAAEPGLDIRLEDRDRLAALAQAIEDLEPEQREVFVLADIESLTVPAIAEILGRNVDTIYSRLRRARARIIRAMATREGSKATSGAA